MIGLERVEEGWWAGNERLEHSYSIIPRSIYSKTEASIQAFILHFGMPDMTPGAAFGSIGKLPWILNI